MNACRYIILLLAGLALTGCGSIDKLTGQTDNTVLPGQREDAVPGRPQFPAPNDSAPRTSAPPVETADVPAAPDCPVDDPACDPMAPADGTFSDPQ
jgi:hypothetical protein